MIAVLLRRTLVSLFVLLAAATVSIPVIRRSILRAAGWTLVVNDPVTVADIIVVSGEGDGPGVLEASDLVHGGVATRVAVFAYAPDAVELEFDRRGIPYENKTVQYIRELRALGVVSAQQVPTFVTGTEDEGPVLAHWCDKERFNSIVVVGTPDHSRRLRRVLHRYMKDHQTTVAVRSSHYSQFDPDQWWKSRSGIRTEIVELEKLLLDIMHHPLS